MTFRAILFDLDGTLVDTIGIYGRAVLASLKEIGIEATGQDYFRWYITPLHLKDILALHGLTEDDVPRVRQRRDALYEKMLRNEAEWLEGAEELLGKVAGFGLRVDGLNQKPETNKPATKSCLVTGSWRSYVDAIDSRLGLRQHFDAIVTCDDMGRFQKPHPHGLLLACERLGVEPGECLYIGDQQFDIDAAHAAGMPCWLIHGKWTPRDAKGAEREFGSAEEIGEALRSTYEDPV